ncbi:hypothetical protein GCM10027289_25150 [Tsukamurella serpentis]
MSATDDSSRPGPTPDDSGLPVPPDHSGSEPPRPGMAERAGDAAKLWLRRIIGAVVVLALLVGVYFILAAIIPRWWAERLGRIIDGSMLTGTGLGLAIGFVCTAVPLLLLVFAGRRVRSRPILAVLAAVLAVIAAVPNLLTLTIVLGTGNASHAGQRILDVAGPMFRGASGVGAVIGLLIAVVLPILAAVLRRRRAARKLQKANEKAAAKQAKLEAKEAARAEKAARRSAE